MGRNSASIVGSTCRRRWQCCPNLPPCSWTQHHGIGEPCPPSHSRARFTNCPVASTLSPAATPALPQAIVTNRLRCRPSAIACPQAAISFSQSCRVSCQLTRSLRFRAPPCLSSLGLPLGSKVPPYNRRGSSQCLRALISADILSSRWNSRAQLPASFKGLTGHIQRHSSIVDGAVRTAAPRPINLQAHLKMVGPVRYHLSRKQASSGSPLKDASVGTGTSRSGAHCIHDIDDLVIRLIAQAGIPPLSIFAPNAYCTPNMDMGNVPAVAQTIGCRAAEAVLSGEIFNRQQCCHSWYS